MNITDIILPPLPNPPSLDQQVKWNTENHILEFYPIWKQLNILNGEDDDAKLKMRTFINDTRNWGNNNPNDLTSVNKIKP